MLTEMLLSLIRIPVSYTHLIIAMFAYNDLVMLVDRVVNKMESRTMEFRDLLNEPAK